MANTPKKQQSTGDDVLAALEDALSVAKPVAGKPDADDKTERPSLTPTPVLPPPSPDDEMFADHAATSGRASRKPGGAANDDRPSVGQILASMHRKPSRTPYYVALGVSVVWTLGQLLYTRARYHEEFAAVQGLSQLFDQPFLVPLLALIVLPVAGFFAFAALYRRSQEMHYVAGAMAEITTRFAEPEGIASDAFVSVGQQIRREIAALGDGMERAVARAAELESMVRTEVSTLERAYDDNEIRVRTLVESLQSERDAIITHAARLQEAIANAHQSYSFDVEAVGTHVNASITDVTNRVIDNFVSQTQTARDHINAAGDEVARSLLDRSQDTAHTLAQIGTEIANAVTARGVKTMESLQDTTDRLADSIATKGDAIRDNLIGRLQKLEDSIVLRGSEVADRVMSDSASLGTQITRGLANFDETIKVHGARIAEEIASNTNLVATEIAKNTDRITGEITRNTDRLNQTTEQSLASFDDRLVKKTHEVAEVIDQRIGRVEKTLDERTRNLNEALASRTLEFARTISEGSKSAQEAVDKNVAGMGEYFSSKANEIASTLSQRTDAIDKVLGTRAIEITQGLDTRVARFEEMVVVRLENVANSIETKSIAAADALAAKIETTTLGLRSETTAVEKSLTQLAERVSETLNSRAREVAAAHETLQTNVSVVLERLNEANGQLKVVLAGIVDNLGPIEGAVGEKIAGFQKTLDEALTSTGSAVTHMDEQLHTLSEVSGRVLTDVSSLTTRFEDQGRYLSTAVDSMSETHRRIDVTLAERREAIEALTGHLSTRSSDLEERLGRFNRILEEQLTAAEGKASEISKLVADATANSTQSIVKQYDIIKNTTNEERDRTTLALRSTYENATNEVNTLFRDMNQRFTDAARELREVANEVQHSLDQTRQELKRGVFELPHETRESTAAMRRLVADQIKALAELNEIVNRYSKNIDHAQPRRMKVNEEAFAAPAPEQEHPAARAEFAPVERPARALPRTEALPARETRERAEPARLPRRPERDPLDDERDSRTERGRRDERPAAAKGSWVSEMLLRKRDDEDDDRGSRRDGRARDEAEAPLRSGRGDDREPAGKAIDAPLRSIESLDALSIDIARLVDHDSSVELWERYKRGERGAFTRRLYTPQGQKTFEDIRRKYRRSSEFRDTVDRYIEEFERLLDQVARDDRGQVLTRTYLTSDTGKVYTLLAHASGRLG